MRGWRSTRHTPWLLLAIGIATACDRSSERPAELPTFDDGVAAAVDGIPISLEAVDAPLRIELHELEIAAWSARRGRLEKLIEARLGAGALAEGSPQWRSRVEWRLERPAPPRFALSAAGAARVGPLEAPVHVTVFVDFASSHVASLQPAFVRLRDVFGDEVAIVFRQLPLPYHRFAREGAVAARCADAAGRFRSFAYGLLQRGPGFTPGDLRSNAERAGLDEASFEACLAGDHARAEVDGDLALAASIGVRRAPTVFVNGLYLSGRPDYHEIDRRVRDELTRLDVAPRMNRDSAKADMPPPPTSSLPAIPAEHLKEPDAIVPLERAVVDEALANELLTTERFESTRGEFSGERLLKLRRVEDGDFFSRLGLEMGDVLLVVNGAFVTESHDHFLDAFADHDVVRVRIMRRGRPYAWEYRIR